MDLSDALTGDADRLATLAIARLDFAELERIHLQLFAEDVLEASAADASLAYQALSLLASRFARTRQETSDGTEAARAAKALAALRANVASRYAELAKSRDGDLAFVVVAFSELVGRGMRPEELSDWASRVRSGPLDRVAATHAFEQLADDEASAAFQSPRDDVCWIMGTDRNIRPDDWQRREQAFKDETVARASAPAVSLRPHRYDAPALRGPARRLVTAIASVYEGGAYIEHFMDNICSQSAFRDWCELIIVDADSPDREVDTIRRYMSNHPNIRYIRTPKRIGIYEAWNLAITQARGELLTNTNLDDLRRHDSLEQQAAALQDLPDADIVYQNFHYALEPNLSFERAAGFGFTSRLPRITPAVMLVCNPPHNAPMWRRRLHDELGLFDTRYRAAGDYEFWLRCVAAGKIFHRIDEPNVVYFHNPNGMSTRSDTPGHRETREITARYARRLLAPRAPEGYRLPQRQYPVGRQLSGTPGQVI